LNAFALAAHWSVPHAANGRSPTLAIDAPSGLSPRGFVSDEPTSVQLLPLNCLTTTAGSDPGATCVKATYGTVPTPVIDGGLVTGPSLTELAADQLAPSVEFTKRLAWCDPSSWM
jgi:hypothetical protein